MRAWRSVVVAAAVAGLLSGCGTEERATAPPVAAGSPSASESPEAQQATDTSPPEAAGAWVLSTDGIGPYRLGAQADDLRKAGLLGEGSPVDAKCPDLRGVAATGVYEGTLVLLVRRNVLVEIGTAGGDPVPRTPEGATLGMSYPALERLYGSRGSSKKDSSGAVGYVVPVGERVLLFSDHPVRPGEAGWMAAGLADQTERQFRTGASC